MIEFPGLWGLKFEINPLALELGNIRIYWYGIIIATGFLLAVLLALKDSRKYDIDPENLIDLVLFATPVAIVTARLYYVAFSWESYKDDPLEILKIWHGGVAIYGAILGALIVAIIYARSKKLGILKLFDFCVPYLALGQGIGRWGNFVNQEAFGANTALPWGMTGDSIREQLSQLQIEGVNINPDMPVHPTFLYESLWDIGAFLFLIWYRKRKKFNGEIFCLYMSIYGAGRFWIEWLRTDSLMLGNLRVSQVLAFIFAVTFAALAVKWRRKSIEEADIQAVHTSKYNELIKMLNEDSEKSAEDSAAVEGNAMEEKDNAAYAPRETLEEQPESVQCSGCDTGMPEPQPLDPDAKT